MLDGGKAGNKAGLIAPFRLGTTKEAVAATKGDADEEEEDDDEEDGEHPVALDPDAPDEELSNKAILRNLTQHLVLTEASLSARRKRVSGTLGIKQGIHGHVIAHAALRIPEKQRKAPFNDGSNVGDHITGVELPDIGPNSGEWMMSYKKKLECYGAQMYKGSGQTAGAGGEPLERSGLEPFSFWTLPYSLVSCVADMFYVKRILDLTAGDGKWLVHGIESGTVVVAIAMTEEHKTMLEHRLTTKTLALMLKPGTQVSNLRFRNAMKENAELTKAVEAVLGAEFATVNLGQGEGVRTTPRKRSSAAESSPLVPTDKKARKNGGRGRGRGRGGGPAPIAIDDEDNEPAAEDEAEGAGGGEDLEADGILDADDAGEDWDPLAHVG